MEILTNPAVTRDWARALRATGKRIGFVPTMGALHDGHRSLIDASVGANDATVVSIFVNPTQFNEVDDFQSYPRTIESDLELCARLGVDVVYAPSVETMYPDGTHTLIDPGPLGHILEGEHRPGHFGGVATVVVKLLNAVEPDVAYFGAKDFQQVAIVRRVVADLDLATRIEALPTVRESDGLAMSSRNTRLAPDARRAATVMYRALLAADGLYRGGLRDTSQLSAAITDTLSTEPACRVDYVALCDPDGFAPYIGQGPVVALVAAWFDEVRLIDNMILSDSSR